MNLDLRFYQEFEKILVERLEKLAAEIVSGKAVDYADYRNRVGRIRGLQDALEAAKDVNARVIGVEDRKDR